MKEIKDKSLEFVLHHYQTGKFDTQKALRKVSPAKVIPLWRKVAVAASFTLLLLAGAYAAFTTGFLSPAEEPVKGEQPAHPPRSLSRASSLLPPPRLHGHHNTSTSTTHRCLRC